MNVVDLSKVLRQPWPATHLLILGFALVKVAVAPWVQLAPHEAHYALYGFYLDLSYVDHPPLVGWLQGLMLNFASSEFALRLIPIALSTSTQYLLALMTQRLFPQESPWLGFVSVLLLQGAIIMHLAVGMAPEVVLAPLSLMVLWLTHSLLAQNRWRDWLALGVVLGLAGLTKYTAITLAFSVLLALLFAGQTRRLLQPKPWLSAVITLVVSSPVFIWNWQHDWLSFVYQTGYQLGGNTDALSWSLSKALGVHLEQIADYSPLIYFGGIAAILWSLRHFDPSSRLVLIFALPILLLFCWASGYDDARPHWTFTGWMFLTPLIGRWLLAGWRRRSVRILTYISGTYSTVLVLLVHLLLAPIVPFPDFKHPLKDVVGWKEAAFEAESLRKTMATDGHTGNEPVLLVPNWHYANRLAWYARPTPVLETRNRLSQYVFWFGEPHKDTRGVLVVPSEEYEAPTRPVWGFACTLINSRPAYYGPSLVNVFHFYECKVS